MENKHNCELLGEKALESARENEAIASVDGIIGHIDASYTVQETREGGTFSEKYNAFWEKTEYNKLMKEKHKFNKFPSHKKKSTRILEFCTILESEDHPEHIDESITDLPELSWDGLDAA
jgi:hypothetical protein